MKTKTVKLLIIIIHNASLIHLGSTFYHLFAFLPNAVYSDTISGLYLRRLLNRYLRNLQSNRH